MAAPLTPRSAQIEILKKEALYLRHQIHALNNRFVQLSESAQETKTAVQRTSVVAQEALDRASTHVHLYSRQTDHGPISTYTAGPVFPQPRL